MASGRGLSLLLMLVVLVSLVFGDEPSCGDQLKALQAKLDAENTRFTLQIASVRRDMESLREDMKSRTSYNEQHNSQMTLEWAMDTVAELRREMKEIETANNASNWQQELRNEVAAILAEAEGVTKLAVADGARLAAGEAKHAELISDVQQVHELAIATRHACDHLREDVRKAQMEWKDSVKMLNKKLYYMNSNEDIVRNFKKSDNIKFNYFKVRHMHSLYKQIQEMKKKLEETQTFVKDDLKKMNKKVQYFINKFEATDIDKIEQMYENHKVITKKVDNITIEMSSVNKMHSSMLELLENMETLENKVDKTIPDFQKEISKLDIDVIQMKSQNKNIKEDHENIHQTIRAIAVTVSNLMDKVENDHRLITKLNETRTYLEDNTKKNIFQNFKNSTQKKDDYAEEKSVKELLKEFQNYTQIREHLREISGNLPKNCEGIDGIQKNIVITPGHIMPVLTSCYDGWTLIQQRIDGSVDFNRNYQEYRNSFGAPTNEYWIGNEALHQLTLDNCSSLRIYMEDAYKNKWYAEYQYFHVASATFGYRLSIDGYSGNASNALEYQNGMEFSTSDKDQDISRSNCAANYEGGWWFSHCQHANLNGKYSVGLTWFNSVQNKLIDVTKTKIMTKNNSDCQRR